jgi:hypothetical protein
LNKKFDLVFIDGDHHYEMVKNDTEKVLRYLAHERTIVVWHDYARNPETVRWEVLAGILSGCQPGLHQNIYHVAHTLCAVYIPGLFIDKSYLPFKSTGSFRVEINRIK